MEQAKISIEFNDRETQITLQGNTVDLLTLYASITTELIGLLCDELAVKTAFEVGVQEGTKHGN